MVALDRASFPRDKVCGDGLTPRAVEMLRRLGVERRLQEMGYRPQRQYRIVSTWGDAVRAGMPSFGKGAGYAYIVPRRDLDVCIVGAARAAGARVLESMRALRLEGSQSRARGGRRVRGRRVAALPRPGADLGRRFAGLVLADLHPLRASSAQRGGDAGVHAWCRRPPGSAQLLPRPSPACPATGGSSPRDARGRPRTWASGCSSRRGAGGTRRSAICSTGSSARSPRRGPTCATPSSRARPCPSPCCSTSPAAGAATAAGCSWATRPI